MYKGKSERVHFLPSSKNCAKTLPINFVTKWKKFIGSDFEHDFFFRVGQKSNQDFNSKIQQFLPVH